MVLFELKLHNRPTRLNLYRHWSCVEHCKRAKRLYSRNLRSWCCWSCGQISIRFLDENITLNQMDGGSPENYSSLDNIKSLVLFVKLIDDITKYGETLFSILNIFLCSHRLQKEQGYVVHPKLSELIYFQRNL